MVARRLYRDEQLNVRQGDTLEPHYDDEGALLGLRAGPRPVAPVPVEGLELEYNSALRLPPHECRRPDEIATPALLQAARAHGARPAAGRFAPSDRGPSDRGRLILPGPGYLPVHLYNDCDKFEVSYGQFRSAKALLAFHQGLVPVLRQLVEEASEILKEQFGDDPHLLLHLSGGDGTTTCASAHLNCPSLDAVAHAAYVSLEAYDCLQETLLRQLALMTTIAATGMPVEGGMLADPRSRTFSQVVGLSTLEPCRALQYNRLQGRPTEGYDREGVGRNMGMCASCGQSQAANFLTAALHQLETLRFHLDVFGLYRSPALVAPGENLLTLAAGLGSDRAHGAALMRQALDDYHAFAEFLAGEVGQEVTEQLVPDHQEALCLADVALTAIVRNDQETVIRTTDYGKKTFLADRYLRGKPGRWQDHLAGIRNVCFAFASPQTLSPYYSYFCPTGTETRIVSDEDVRDADPDPFTRSWFFARIARRFWHDPWMDYVHWDWDRLVLRRPTVFSGGWIPDIRVEQRAILLPGSVGAYACRWGTLLDTQAQSLGEVFEAFGSTPQATAEAV